MTVCKHLENGTYCAVCKVHYSYEKARQEGREEVFKHIELIQPIGGYSDLDGIFVSWVNWKELKANDNEENR